MAGSMITTPAEYVAELARAAATIDQRAVQRYADTLLDAWTHDRQVLIFGNGGSHANASHTVADFVKTAMVDGKRRLRALCMSDNLPMLTALGNDMGYDTTFSFPLESYGRPGDVAVAISCSGNSPNILRAAESAKRLGMTLVALTGMKGGKVGPMADIHINVASDNFGVIEDLHMSVGHIAAQMFHNRLRTA
ncbi:MAG TPA: SIS domain-containing protein [Phycisphaerales bacterium]|nr:SIS domain-containing protein [Phycisphaerales bacterium]